MTRLQEIKKKLEEVRAIEAVEPGILHSEVVDELIFIHVPYLIDELERARKHIRDTHKLLHDYFGRDKIVAEGSGEIINRKT